MYQLASRKLELEEFNQLCVVEYSVSQNSVSVRSVNEMLEANRRNLSQQRGSDYLPVVFTQTHNEAVELSNKLTDNISELVAQQTKLESERGKVFIDSEDKLWSFFITLDSNPPKK